MNDTLYNIFLIFLALLGIVAMEVIYRIMILYINKTKKLRFKKKPNVFIIGCLKIFSYIIYWEILAILTLIGILFIYCFSHLVSAIITIIIIIGLCVLVYYNKKWTDDNVILNNEEDE